MIPILDSQQITTPEKGLTTKIPSNAADSSSEGGAGRAFSDILGSHGASLVEDADGSADQSPNIKGGNVLLPGGQDLPPTPLPGLATAVPVFDLRHRVESSPPLADTTPTTADVPRDLPLPLAGQGSVDIELIVPVSDEPVSVAVVAVGQSTTERPGEEIILPGMRGANEAFREIGSAPYNVPAEVALQRGALGADKVATVPVPVAAPLNDSVIVSRAAEVILPVTPGLGDLAKKFVDQSSLSQGSVLESHTVSPADSRPVKPQHAFPVELRPVGDMNALPATVSVTKLEGGVERAEAQVSQSVNALDLNQYRLFPGAQPTLLSAGQILSAAQNLATGPSFASPVSDGGWGHEFVGRMNLMVKNGVQEMKLQLKPAEMGLLEIKLSTEGDQAKVIFNVHNAAARDAIDLAMPRLRDMLEQSGLQLAHSEVNDSSSQQDQGNGSDNLAGLTADSGFENEPAEGLQLEVAVRVADSLIDYYI